ncbi:hypothetical protein K0M31_015175 [Melipona bicolor]|uniref:NADH dehydrogenase [ubiquinone] iron-sulfur protein 5 n=1 Tax=Melipona bicolor TaxID=60889 RepID=A0AA40KFQ0_9HYME|nr:hypothetical protein K0M31_015175 [Melipona bicolor]
MHDIDSDLYKYKAHKVAIDSPFNKMSSVLSHAQYHAECRDFELNIAKCIDAYGFHKAIQECKPLIHDFEECLYQEKRRQRFEILAGEFHRQVKAGERKYEKAPFIAML